MKFETIKDNAKKLFAGVMGQWDRGLLGAHDHLLKGGMPSFDALLPFVLATQAEREEMREFAQLFDAKKGDWLAGAAKSEQSKKLDVAWNQVVLRAREAGLDLIEKWDVRQAGKLIELFPEAVPAKYRGKSLTCYMADNEDSDWLVEVDSSHTPSCSPAFRM